MSQAEFSYFATGKGSGAGGSPASAAAAMAPGQVFLQGACVLLHMLPVCGTVGSRNELSARTHARTQAWLLCKRGTCLLPASVWTV